MAAALDATARIHLQKKLLDLDGVLHASFHPGSHDLWIVRDPSYDQGPLELAVRNHVAHLGYDPTALNVRLTLPTPSGPRRRVRFESLQRDEDHGRVTVTVRLEWDEVVHEGSATGEEGAAIELKTTARAAINALERLTKQSLSLRIIGVKAIRAFDSDLMVASLIRADADHQRLVGAVVVSEGTLEAAALAVLSALNRTLGNSLQTTD